MNLVWNEDGTVSYKRKKFWYFEREMSVGPLTDVVTTINVPVVGSAEFVRGDFFLEWGVSDMLSTIQVQMSPFFCCSCLQLLFPLLPFPNFGSACFVRTINQLSELDVIKHLQPLILDEFRAFHSLLIASASKKL